MTDYLRFRSFAAPYLIELLFWSAILLATVATCLSCVIGLYFMSRGELLLYIGLIFIFPPIFALPFVILAVRVLCEQSIIFFRMYEELKTMNAGRIVGPPAIGQ